MPENLPDKVKIKANKRMIQKIKKPLFILIHIKWKTTIPN